MFKMKATQCFFYKIENERNAFSRLMGMELPLTNFQFC